ncbi:MAG: hypothetical protein IJ073_06775 [Lachnospiraceae bacterium]|nr:hypothetical protein [Lachnospiraceae bacterium]
MIRGTTIQLLNRVETGKDWANCPVYEETAEKIENVLVGEPSTEDITDTLNLYGKHVSYILAIPKGDTHNWTDTKVILPEPFAGVYRTIGFPTAGIEENIPGPWNKKVKVERYVEGKD